VLTRLLLVVLEQDVGEFLKARKLKLYWFDSQLSVLDLPFFIAVGPLQSHILFPPRYRQRSCSPPPSFNYINAWSFTSKPPILHVMILEHSDKYTFTANPQELGSFFKILLVVCLCPILYQYCLPNVLLLIAAGIRVALYLFACCPLKNGLGISRFVISELEKIYCKRFAN